MESRRRGAVDAGCHLQGDIVSFLYWPRLFSHSQELYEREGQSMITAIVKFKLPQPVTREQARDMFLSTAPKYREVHGLIRKYYVLSEDGGTGGGVYLWKSRKDAEQLYTDDWKKFIIDKYGTEPSIEYFEAPVIVDNLVGEIIKGD
jgi:hypothetical protein